MVFRSQMEFRSEIKSFPGSWFHYSRERWECRFQNGTREFPLPGLHPSCGAPSRTCRGSWKLAGHWMCFTFSISSSPTLATLSAWFGLRSGTPPATMYTASPSVSTWRTDAEPSNQQPTYNDQLLYLAKKKKKKLAGAIFLYRTPAVVRN